MIPLVIYALVGSALLYGAVPDRRPGASRGRLCAGRAAECANPWHNREMTVAAFPRHRAALGLWALVQLVVASAAALGRAIVNAERWGMHNARRLFVAAAAALAPLLAQLGTWIVAVLKMAWGWLASLPRHLVHILHFLWQMAAGLRHAVAVSGTLSAAQSDRHWSVLARPSRGCSS
ncbi:MAG: hypothetical protein IPK19_20795 [Chloroflexi bacterium]|nr:hypothetical protein [Chloroflexota bacterium]